MIGSGGGQPLDPGVRADMEARLGHDFGDVRVHDDARAEDSARAVNAHAYTVGPNIVFQRDRYDPSSDAGRVTLAHELTHVVQQRSGPVDGTAAARRDQAERPVGPFRAGGRRQCRTSDGNPRPGAPATSAPAPAAVQRQEDEQEEEQPPTAQGAFVQRDEGEEELEE